MNTDKHISKLTRSNRPAVGAAHYAHDGYGNLQGRQTLTERAHERWNEFDMTPEVLDSLTDVYEVNYLELGFIERTIMLEVNELDLNVGAGRIVTPFIDPLWAQRTLCENGGQLEQTEFSHLVRRKPTQEEFQMNDAKRKIGLTDELIDSSNYSGRRFITFRADMSGHLNEEGAMKHLTCQSYGCLGLDGGGDPSKIVHGQEAEAVRNWDSDNQDGKYREVTILCKGGSTAHPFRGQAGTGVTVKVPMLDKDGKVVDTEAVKNKK
jgi:hypothetical protein